MTRVIDNPDLAPSPATTADHQPHSLWLDREPLVLASASPTRLAMLQQAGLQVQATPAQLDEREVEARHLASGNGAAGVAEVLATAKAVLVARRYPARLILGADQTLHCEGLAFHKPADTQALAEQLAQLQGRTHHLTSAFALVRSGVVLANGSASAAMTMRPLSPAMIAHYITALGERAPMTVGGYQLEHLGSHLFERIEGDHFTVLGLPVLAVLDALRRLGVVAE